MCGQGQNSTAYMCKVEQNGNAKKTQVALFTEVNRCFK
jgi:hypothetical protein